AANRAAAIVRHHPLDPSGGEAGGEEHGGRPRARRDTNRRGDVPGWIGLRGPGPGRLGDGRLLRFCSDTHRGQTPNEGRQDDLSEHAGEQSGHRAPPLAQDAGTTENSTSRVIDLPALLSVILISSRKSPSGNVASGTAWPPTI